MCLCVSPFQSVEMQAPDPAGPARTSGERLGAIWIPTVTAGILPPLIGFIGTVALVIRGLERVGASQAETGSAIATLGLAVGATGALLSWRWRMPVVLAWSTPGAALLASSVQGGDYALAVGAFVVAAALMMSVALVPGLAAAASRIPTPIASGMLAGILLPFCLKLFIAVSVDPAFSLAALVSYLAMRARKSRYALASALLAGTLVFVVRGGIGAPHGGSTPFGFEYRLPVFDLHAFASIAIPLFLVTLVSQNLPGLVVMQTAGYRPSPRGALLVTGVVTLVTAPLGAFSVNLAALTASLCTGPDAHPDPTRRWVVGVLYGAVWITLGIVGGRVVANLASIPPTVMAVVTGLALMGPLIGAIQTIATGEEHVDEGVITMIASASGVTLLGVGSAFWGLAAGLLMLAARSGFRTVRSSAAASSTPVPSGPTPCTETHSAQLPASPAYAADLGFGTIGMPVCAETAKTSRHRRVQ